MKSAVALAVVSILGGTSFLLRGSFSSMHGDSQPTPLVFAVHTEDMTITVKENGSVMAKESTKIGPESKNGGKITFLVDEGKTVEKDDILCRLDTTDLEANVQKLELEILQTSADLDRAKTELDIQTSENTGKIEKAQLTLDKATQGLEKYLGGDAPKELRTLTIAIKDAEINHSQAQKKHEDSQKLFERHFITKTQVESDRIEYERTDLKLQAAKGDLELFNKYTYPMTVAEKKAAAIDADRTLINEGKRAKSALRQKEVGVESNKLKLQNLQQQLAIVKKEIEFSTIRSPSPGLVIYGDPNQPWYRNQVRLGNQIWSGMTLFTIPDLRVMQVQVQIHEADINKVKVGQTAVVTMDTYPGIVFNGEVAKIASIAGDPNSRRQAEVKKFAVDLVLESTEGLTLKPGISAKVEIFVDRLENILTVPLQSVFVENGNHYCYAVSEDGGYVKREIETGTSNETSLQVLRGLTEGDRILLYNPSIGGAEVSVELSKTPLPIIADKAAAMTP